MKLSIEVFLCFVILFGFAFSSCNQQSSTSRVNIHTLTSEEKAELKYYELGKNTFNMYCSACHRLSDKLVGPPLIETTKNHSIEWVIEFTRNPMRMIKEKKDPQAIKIYNEYNQLEMPRFESLRDSTIKAIFYFIDYRPNPEVAVP